jgi:DNA-directed RNA polymerase specialized sigma24 family protein
MHELNEFYFLFTQRGVTRGEFEGLVYDYLVKNQEKTNISHWKNEEYEDFLSWFYPRLHKAVDSYRETGASFEVFINTIMRVAAKEYHTRMTAKSVTEYSAWSVHVPELYAREEAPHYSYDPHEKKLSGIIANSKGRKNPRQLLALILKCYYYVSDDFLDRAACHAGIERKKLKEMIETLKTIRSEKDDEIYRMKERVYCQYYRCIVYEKRLSYLPENTNAYAKLKLRLEKARKRLEKMRERISKIRSDATNKEIAQVIGVSKGSVDSSLYNLKSKWYKSLLN